MSELDERSQGGIPIYVDPIDRGLPDPTEMIDSDWHPATNATVKLWRCYEALQKLSAVLEGVCAQQSEAKQRRFLIHCSVPLCDFFLCVRDLTNVIESDEQSRSCLHAEQLTYVRTLRTRFREAVLDRIEPLKAVRDKLGAHTDKSLAPDEARKLVGALDIHMVAAWLHAGLLVLDKLTRLDCFAWTSIG